MRLGNKGFAITSIVYSILVLFLALVLLMLNNMSVRQNIFDKQKSDILDKIEGPEAPVIIDKICVAVSESEWGNVPEGNFEYGDEYICNVDGTHLFHFYVLENGDSGSSEIANSGEVSLMMADPENAVLFNWNDLSNLEDCVKYFSNGHRWNIDRLSIPTYSQIMAVYEEECYFQSTDYTYWTSTEYDNASMYCIDEAIDSTCNKESDQATIRPVITISKNDIGN